MSGMLATATPGLVFLIDVDNTLLDNDHIIADLRAHLECEFGAASAGRYWTHFEALRSELGYADYLGALQRYRSDPEFERDGGDSRLLQMSSFLVDYPFALRLYPRVHDVIARLDSVGSTVILTDGDVVFQPRKVQRSGLWDAVRGRVLIYIHKEHMLDAMQRQYPARHYVMIDDKLRILAAMKQRLTTRLTTVFVRQGHYAHDPRHTADQPSADMTLECIGDLLDIDLAGLDRRGAGRPFLEQP